MLLNSMPKVNGDPTAASAARDTIWAPWEARRKRLAASDPLQLTTLSNQSPKLGF